MESTIVGRDTELARATRALAGAGVVQLDGPAGIGKTAIWSALRHDAERRGWLVLACAPTESETALPFAALADLLRPLGAAVPALPPPQRTAVQAVLLSAAADAVDERAVSAATRSLLDAAAAADHPVLVAIDDAHWLDPPSARALRFALRRVNPLSILATSRSEAPAPLGVDQNPLAQRLTQIGLAPLGVAALHHVLRARLGRSLSRPLLARLVREAGGNPLMVIELARAVLRLPEPPPPTVDLPVPTTAQQLVAQTLASLPEDTRQAVRLAALLSVARLTDLAGVGVCAHTLEPAEEAGLIAVMPDLVRFAHPIYAAAIRSGIPPGMRRRLHRMIADATADPDERARHLAGCATTPDAVTAVALTDAARRQRFRGAPELAAELYERAAQLTPPQSAEEWAVRHLAAARCRFDCGDYAAAGASALAAAEKLTGDARAEALLLHAVVAWSTDDLGIAVASARQALAATTADTSLAGRIHAHLSLFVDEPTAGRQHAQAAVTLLSGDEGQRPLLSAALLLLLFNEVRGGLPARTELLDQALLLEENEPSWLAGTVPASWWKAIDEHDLARARLQRMLRVAADQGDEPWQHELLAHLGETELLAGQWDAAERHIAEARELGEQLGTGVVGETWLVGMLHAYRGNLAEAELIAESGLKRADSFGDAWCRRIHLQLAGFVELSAGRFAAAAATYGALAAAADDLGLVEPIALRFEPDWIEACVGCGDLDAAAAAFERLHLRHERLPRPWTTLGLARCRVLLDGARGTDTAPALAQLAEARAQVRADILPMDQARCLLIAGVAHRRARRRRQSREDLVAAAEGFRAIGALAFADRAETELARIGGRQSAPRGLTATEEMVARLAAAGRTNRVIADELFLSPKTVEANLARAYTKLGISSRAQLSAALTDRPPIKP